MAFQLNGKRNYEYLSDFIKAILQTKVNLPYSVNIVSEKYEDPDPSDFPMINVVLQEVSPNHRDPVNTRNTCNMNIVVYGDSLTQGLENSKTSKKTVLEICGQIDNIFSKSSAYFLKFTSRVIGNVASGGIKFAPKEVYNASGAIFAIIEFTFEVTEDNNDLFVEIYNNLVARVEDGNSGKGYDYKEN